MVTVTSRSAEGRTRGIAAFTASGVLGVNHG